MWELWLQFQLKQKPLFITKLERFSFLLCSLWKNRLSGANMFRAKPSLHSSKWASGSCELIGCRSSMWDLRGTRIMNVWLTRSSRCPRCGRGSRTRALCPWWTSWLRLAGSLAGFLRKSLAGGQVSRESALRHKDLDLCRRLTAHSLLRLSWFHLHYHTNSLSFTRGAFQLRKLRFGFLYSEQWLLKQTWACEYRSRTQKGANRNHTDGLDDGVLDDSLFALFAAAAGWNAGAGVSPGALAQLEVHAHPQVFEQSVEHLQHCWTCSHTHTQPAERTHHCKGKTDSGPKGFQPGESVKNWEELTSVKLNKSTFLNVFASSKRSTQLKLMLKLGDFHLFFTKILHWWRFYMFHSILTENNGH